MLIVLLGYMGCGKSAVGELLAKKLHYSFFDLDTEIEEQVKLTVDEIFQKKGEDHFRKLETEMLSKLIQNKESVIAVGGGTPCFNNNMELITKHSKTIYLKTPAGVLFSRLLKKNKIRPLIKDLTSIQLMDYIIDTLMVREQFYSKAEWTIETEKLSVEKITDSVVQLFTE